MFHFHTKFIAFSCWNIKKKRFPLVTRKNIVQFDNEYQMVTNLERGKIHSLYFYVGLMMKECD